MEEFSKYVEANKEELGITALRQEVESFSLKGYAVGFNISEMKYKVHFFLFLFFLLF